MSNLRLVSICDGHTVLVTLPSASVLLSTHRGLHNRMHKLGYYHEHNKPVTDHPEHHQNQK